MGHSTKEGAALALHRFGMGPRPGSIAAIESDPRGALLAELDKPRAGEIAASLPGSGQAFRTVADANAERQAKQIKNVKYVELPGGPHGVLWTHADQINSALVKFLR